EPREVAARPGEAGDKAQPDRGVGDDEDDGDRPGCGLGREHRGIPGPPKHPNFSTPQLGGQLRQPIRLIVGPAVFDGDVLTLDEARFLQSLAECTHAISTERCRVEEPDHRHRRLLRARTERPRRGAAEKANEVTSPHIRTQAQGQYCIGSNAYFDRLKPGIKPLPQRTANVADGSISSDRPASDALGMSASPPIATELVTRGSPSLCVNSGLID